MWPKLCNCVRRQQLLSLFYFVETKLQSAVLPRTVSKLPQSCDLNITCSIVTGGEGCKQCNNLLRRCHELRTKIIFVSCIWSTNVYKYFQLRVTEIACKCVSSGRTLKQCAAMERMRNSIHVWMETMCNSTYQTSFCRICQKTASGRCERDRKTVGYLEVAGIKLCSDIQGWNTGLSR